MRNEIYHEKQALPVRDSHCRQVIEETDEKSTVSDCDLRPFQDFSTVPCYAKLLAAAGCSVQKDRRYDILTEKEVGVWKNKCSPFPVLDREIKKVIVKLETFGINVEGLK